MLKEIVLLFLTLFGTTNCNYCTDKCQFSLSFDEPFHLPDHCPQEYGHNYIQCHADLQIDYIEKTVDVNLYADENIPTGGSLYQMDLFSSFDQPDEQVTASLQYSCVYVDDCARNFTEERYKMLLDHQKILYAMKNNLYNVGSSNVQQCYDLDNKTIDCKNGLCRTELGSYVQSDDPYTIIPYYKTYCDYYPPDDPFHNRTGFMSTTTQGIPVEFKIFDRLYYVCNKNLCNNYWNIQFMQQLVHDFNNFDKPSRATTPTISSALVLTMTLSLIKFFFSFNSYLK